MVGIIGGAYSSVCNQLDALWYTMKNIQEKIVLQHRQLQQLPQRFLPRI